MEGDLGWCYGSRDDNWDLHAVVRFACGGGGGHVTSPKASDESLSWLPLAQKDEKMDAAARQSLPADEDLCLFAAPKPDAPQLVSQRNEAPPAKPRTSYRHSGRPARSKRKKKKIQVSKEVTRVPAGAPSPDPWAWRKYGQKPIKGTPYPRGYYRCSTDKDCKARKQVERCRVDHTTLIVTYTGGDHSHPVPLHRNSLAGTTRNKAQPRSSTTSPGEEEPPQPQTAPTASPSDAKPQASPPPASTELAPTNTQICPLAGVEHVEEDDEEAVAASLLIEDAEMEGEDDVLQFLKPAPGSDNGSGWEDTMLFPEPNEPSPGPGNGGGCDWEDFMQFAKVHESSPTTRPNRTGGGSPAAMNIAEERFPVSGLSQWEAAAVPASSIWA